MKALYLCLALFVLASCASGGGYRGSDRYYYYEDCDIYGRCYYNRRHHEHRHHGHRGHHDGKRHHKGDGKGGHHKH